MTPFCCQIWKKAGYNYRLWVPGESFGQAHDEAGSTVIDSGTFNALDAVDYSIMVPNHNWMLSLSPQTGWIDWGRVAIGLLMGLTISMLLAVVVRLSQIRRHSLQEMLTTDELTGLHNRRWFSEKMEQWCSNTSNKLFSILFLDLNDFKLANDTMGHKYGDELLIHVARLLEEACAGKGIPVRLAGDEFVVMLPNADRKAAEEFIARVHNIFETAFVLDGNSWSVSLSIGIATYPVDGTDYDSLIRVADDRMYAEKRTRNKG